MTRSMQNNVCQTKKTESSNIGLRIGSKRTPRISLPSPCWQNYEKATQLDQFVTRFSCIFNWQLRDILKQCNLKPTPISKVTCIQIYVPLVELNFLLDMPERNYFGSTGKVIGCYLKVTETKLKSLCFHLFFIICHHFYLLLAEYRMLNTIWIKATGFFLRKNILMKLHFSGIRHNFKNKTSNAFRVFHILEPEK